MMKNTKGILVALTVVSALLVLTSGCGEKAPAIPKSEWRAYANDLYNRELYAQAVDAYRQYLNMYDLDPRERANINFQIASIYFDRLHDYENALATYIKIKRLYPESGLMDEVNKQIVACLERLQRSADAKQALVETTSLDTSQVPKKRPGAVIARIGNREITQGDLDFEINRLPPSMRQDIRTRQDKLNFLREYIATELLYNDAKRQGLDRDKDVIEGAFQAKKQLMVQKLIEKEIASQLPQPSESDLETYYKANKDRYAEKDKDGKTVRERPFSEVRQQVLRDYMQQKMIERYQELVDRLMQAEGVEIYESKVQ